MPSRTGAAAPPLRLLPTLVGEAALHDPGRGPAGLPFALEEHRLEVVRLDLFGPSPHLLVLGDTGCGRSSLLRLLARRLAARHPPEEVALLVVDVRRGLRDLAALPNLAAYACTPAAVAQAVDHLHHQLTAHPPPDPDHDLDPARLGPRHVVLVDDYDLLPVAGGSPLLPLVDLLGLGRELGFHVVLARRVAGAARAGFEPVFQRLRELGGSGLLMSGDPAEGPLMGGHKAVPLPPGRGLLVGPGGPARLVQVAWSPPPGRGKCAGQSRETGCRRA
jgi:S-DNA-T family DNA segregation ATPase FtsK/SpoIIIE